MKAVVYECPSCGGKVSFNKKNNVWVCHYCKKNFSTLFNSNKSLDIKSKDLFLYFLKCNNCGYVGDEKKLDASFDKSLCPTCGESLNVTKNKIGGVLSHENSLFSFEKEYEKAFRYFSSKYKKIPKEFANYNMEFKYFTGKIYNGIINVEYSTKKGNRKKRKYVLFDLLIPDDDKIKFYSLYAISCVGISGYMLKHENNETDPILRSKAVDISSNRPVITDDLFDACIAKFRKDFNLSENDEIIVNKKVEVIENVLIPVYYTVINYNDNLYYNYVLELNKPISILNFPIITKENFYSVKNKARKFDFISNLSKTISIIMVLLTFLLFTLSFIFMNKDNQFFFSLIFRISQISAVLTIIVAIVTYRLTNKYKLLSQMVDNNSPMNKDDYFNKILDGKNKYVKYFDF